MQTVLKNALFFSLFFIITTGQASTQDQPQDELLLRALAQAIMAESAGLVPRTIETEIKIFDRSGRRIGSEIGTITLTRLSDGSLRSAYDSKTAPRSRPQAGASQGSPGKAPSGGPGGRRPAARRPAALRAAGGRAAEHRVKPAWTGEQGQCERGVDRPLHGRQLAPGAGAGGKSLPRGGTGPGQL